MFVRGPKKVLKNSTHLLKKSRVSKIAKESKQLSYPDLRTWQAGSSGVGCCEGAFRFRGLAGGPILDCDGTRMACASSSSIVGAEISPFLQEEIYRFVGAVMHPESRVQWGQLAQWQRNLQVQATGRQLLNPFWQAVLFDLDTELHLCMEVFTKLLVEEKWPLALLAGWQESLQGQTHKLWYPGRLWHELIHNLDLTAGIDPVRRRLTELLVYDPDMQEA